MPARLAAPALVHPVAGTVLGCADALVVILLITPMLADHANAFVSSTQVNPKAEKFRV